VTASREENARARARVKIEEGLDIIIKLDED